ncbi:hypothetical protein SEF58_04385 [Neomoorella humiferrea]|uniref:ABC-2 transporter permease n=1 Tax=Neomoorella humiferrea TaxID=676965 RepID=UPI003D8F40CC
MATTNISGWQKLGRLYRKELRDLRLESMVVLGLILLWNFFLYYKAGTATWPPGTHLVFSLMMLVITGFLPLIESFKIWGDEWKNNTVYLLLSLPVNGQQVVLAKLLAVLTQFILLSLAALLATGALFKATVLDAYFVMINNEIWQLIRQYRLILAIITVNGILELANVVLLAFLGSLLGQSVRKFSGWLAGAFFLAGMYVSGKLATWLAKVLNYLPWPTINIRLPLNFHSLSISASSGEMSIYAGTAALLLVTILLFITTVLFYNRRVEL